LILRARWFGVFLTPTITYADDMKADGATAGLVFKEEWTMRQVVCLAGLVIALVGYRTAAADDSSFDSLNGEIEGLRTRLAALESSAGRADAGCGAEACCNCNCCPSCCPLASCSGWIGGGDLLFLKPHWENNTALAVGTIGATDTFFNLDFNYDFETAYSLWAGYRGGSGFGLRGRYFEFNHSSSLAFAPGADQFVSTAAPLSLVLTGGVGNTFDVASDLELHTVDFEGSQVVSVCGFTIDASAGVRYFRMEQHYDAVESSGVFTGALRSRHDFEGVGPVLALEVRRDVGDTGFSLYGTARGSVLFGDAKQVVDLEARNAGVLLGASHAENSRCDVIPVAEMEVGAEYALWAGCARWFVRTSMVGQVYGGAGNASNNELFYPFGTDETTDNGANLGLFGLRISAGVNY
jgi:Legionella pneumophila major outer membrane protein precursor